MSQRLIRVLLWLGWALFAWASLWTPVSAGPWLSALALPVLAVGFFWGEQSPWILSGLSLLLCIVLRASGVPVVRLAGPIGVFIGLPFILGRLQRGFRSQGLVIAQRESDLHERVRALGAEQQRWRTSIQERERSIQEISALYQLSRRFLSTLEWKEAEGITEEALAKWMPSLKEFDRGQHLQRMGTLVEQGRVSVEALIQSVPLTGTDFAARERWAIVSGQLALGLQRVSLYRQVQESATHDGLTGLLVRRTFLERLAEEVERAQRHSASVAFLMVDLDRFKQVNDTFGHLVGDVVLREVARLIRNSVREMDLVGRYGGEEFGVVLPDANFGLGIQIAERIRVAVEAVAIQAYDEQIRITVSVGVALCPAHATTAEQLIEKADRAMYRAKSLGRNQTVAAPERSA